MRNSKENIGLTFVNYNYAFNNFYENYKNQCLLISEKTLLHEIEDIRKIITTFIYDYDYTINEKSKRLVYREKLREIKDIFDSDSEIAKIITKDFDILTNRLAYHRKYYSYFMLYLNIMGQFISELTATFMPNTNVQKKLIKFSNNQTFFEKFTQHKKIVLENLSEFKIHEFNKSYNTLITFYYAYSLFINHEDKIILDNLFSIILSIYLSEDNLFLLANQNISGEQRVELRKMENMIHESLLFCNSKMNLSFSNYDVLPKLQNKIYLDKTLI